MYFSFYHVFSFSALFLHNTTCDARVQRALAESEAVALYASALLITDNSVSTIRCQFVIIASLGQFGISTSLLLPLHQVSKLDSDNSVSVRHYCFPCRQFGVSSSLLLPLDNSVSVHHRQFGVSSSLLLPLDNSVSVHHYCFPCIKSVSWIHGKTSKTDRR